MDVSYWVPLGYVIAEETDCSSIVMIQLEIEEFSLCQLAFWASRLLASKMAWTAESVIAQVVGAKYTGHS